MTQNAEPRAIKCPILNVSSFFGYYLLVSMNINKVHEQEDVARSENVANVVLRGGKYPTAQPVSCSGRFYRFSSPLTTSFSTACQLR